MLAIYLLARLMVSELSERMFISSYFLASAEYVVGTMVQDYSWMTLGRRLFISFRRTLLYTRDSNGLGYSMGCTLKLSGRYCLGSSSRLCSESNSAINSWLRMH